VTTAVIAKRVQATRRLAGIRAVIEAAGAKLGYLPPYSPDRNLIDLACAKLKKLFRDGSGTNRR
jgi:transposase